MLLLPCIDKIFNNTYFGNDQPYFFSSRDKMLMSKFNTQVFEKRVAEINIFLITKKLVPPKMAKCVVSGTTGVMGVIRTPERKNYA